LRNGDGPTVLLRADMDALPVAEQTGLSLRRAPLRGTDRTATTCGSCTPAATDLHVTCLLGALDLLAGARSALGGTRCWAVLPTAEEVGRGAQGMVDEGLFERLRHARTWCSASMWHQMPVPG